MLQKAYITESPYPAGSKVLLDRADGDLEYHKVHAKHHSRYRALIDRMGYYDLFLFNIEGDLVYSVYKVGRPKILVMATY